MFYEYLSIFFVENTDFLQVHFLFIYELFKECSVIFVIFGKNNWRSFYPIKILLAFLTIWNLAINYLLLRLPFLLQIFAQISTLSFKDTKCCSNCTEYVLIWYNISTIIYVLDGCHELEFPSGPYPTNSFKQVQTHILLFSRSSKVSGLVSVLHSSNQ